MLPPTIYFLFVLHIIVIARNLLAEEWGMMASSSAVATLGALIIGKAIIIVDALPLFSGLGKKRHVYDIGMRTVLYLLIAMLLQFLEEFVPLYFKSDSLSMAIAHISSDINWLQFWVSHLIMLIFLVNYTVIVGVIRVVGHDVVRDALLNPLPEEEAPTGHEEAPTGHEAAS